MKYHTLGLSLATAAFALTQNATNAATVTFETVSLPGSGFWNGSDLSGGITLEGNTFKNNYNTTWGSWSGFAVSNHTDTTTAGWGNQYSSFAGNGAGGSAQYAVGFFATYEDSTHVSLGAMTDLTGVGTLVTNSTYAGISMRDGDGVAKKFGGLSGDAPDWLMLTIEGYASGAATETSVNFYLADFRDADNSKDYILDTWKYLDFTALGTVDELRFSLSSSDNGEYGMNTPSYFAIDNFMSVPEPSTLLCSLAGLGLLTRRRR
jgi:hypothetical protein